MRYGEKQWEAHQSKDIYGVDFHQFVKLEEGSSHMEIAQELGISLGEVKMLKKKIIRT